ncbi:protein translocase subunit SecD [Thermoclostridium stercorarium subsp. stercorarium DSM 8532]|uniref:Protein translocase subunit SecD n=1 Tax=Thermoclostridium stercorarium (strain ATCC 35414 / DSM 8532 / NCIMB 11754) TaxID=1121335 RepID=L7VRT5_THES1|nr:protein translocase subunit SecD [Thermoclostridium stercorarium]AGC69076.1 protein translocase subunit SecD [Thermoclostridium stercorarium subsp. stercorarium DSM 8532]AGI40049.1 protein-export membrane protein [Thermoclostridium stercorarium subsp. stercorarium DSM 8532]UZQ85037.1 protein translocase subunit SecD [Thermoclostridium stercorarium]
MQKYGILKLVSVILVITVCAFLAYNEVKKNNIRTGIDIRGGIYAVLEPDIDKSSLTDDEIDKGLESAKTILGKRLDAKNIFDRSINIDSVNDRIIIEIPWAAGETNFNPQDQLNELGKTALLTFQEVDEDKVDENGIYLPTGKIIIQGNQVKDANAAPYQEQGSWVVALELDESGSEAFAEATGRLVGKPIAIFMDDQLISAPIVNQKIEGGKAIITGMANAEEAAELAATIRSGALPFRLVATKVDSISPQLGEGAMNVAVKAGIIGFLLVCLFMILVYRLPGVIASIALFGLAVLTILSVAWTGISITLPGIGGIILSIGMGVDANCVIYERIKEELRAGKTLRSAIDQGFHRAFAAVLDSNVTTLISAVVLYALGSGPIKGFALTLGIGVAISFLTAVTATKLMLEGVSGIGAFKNKWLYGVK